MAMTETNPFRFDDVEQRVEEHIRHPYLVKNKVRRSVSRFHSEMIVAILRVAGVPQEESTKILDAALLLQHGLSIHDEVDTHLGLKRQLIVLAGDYSSSHYYAVLSQVGNLPLMSTLCNAVVKINEAKMTLHNSGTDLPSETSMELLFTVHGELLFGLIEYYSLDKDYWTDHVRSLVRAYIIHEEMENFPDLKYFTLRQAYDWLSDAMDRIVNQTDNWFEPVSSLLMESLVLVQTALDNKTYAEDSP